MAKNQAIVIGINKYNPNNLTPLNYAQRDAELVRDFFEQEAGFEKVYFFSDDAAEINLRPGVSIPSQPTLGNLESFLQDYFEKPRLKAGDNFWFFFAGHGLRYADRDYLMPCDANPRNVERTAIPVSYVTERLRRCGADNVVLILDACRNIGGRGVGIGDEYKQQGVVTIFSCSPSEISYEIEQLKQGAFTHILLEALRIQGEGNCATVERLYQYLSYRVPELNRQHGKPRQTPYIIAEPATKLHLILLPKYATLRDIEKLKLDAYKAEVEGDLELAKQLWIRVNIAAMGSDMDVISAFQRIAQRVGHEVVSQLSSDSQVRGGRSPQPSLQREAKITVAPTQPVQPPPETKQQPLPKITPAVQPQVTPMPPVQQPSPETTSYAGENVNEEEILIGGNGNSFVTIPEPIWEERGENVNEEEILMGGKGKFLTLPAIPEPRAEEEGDGEITGGVWKDEKTVTYKRHSFW